jgi:hypothetical protein
MPNKADKLVYNAAVDSSFELLSSVTVGLGYAIEEVSPMTHFVEKRYTREKHMTTKRRQPEIGVRILFELIHDVIVNFDLGAVTSATKSRSRTTLIVVQIGNYY